MSDRSGRQFIFIGGLLVPNIAFAHGLEGIESVLVVGFVAGALGGLIGGLIRAKLSNTLLATFGAIVGGFFLLAIALNDLGTIIAPVIVFLLLGGLPLAGVLFVTHFAVTATRSKLDSKRKLPGLEQVVVANTKEIQEAPKINSFRCGKCGASVSGDAESCEKCRFVFGKI